MALVSDQNAIKRKRSRGDITTVIEPLIQAATVGNEETITFTVDTNGDITASRHALAAEALLDAVDALTAETPTAITIERNADGTLTLT